MRAFLGIELSLNLREVLDECGRAVRAQRPEWEAARWVPPENMHVTLKFLGEQSPELVDRLVAVLVPRLAARTRFSLVLTRAAIGVPAGRRSRMLWSIFDDPTGECACLASAIDDAAAGLAIPAEERRFRAHVTLARARTPRRFTPPVDLERHVTERLGGDSERAMSVGEVTLFSSTLTGDGPIYDRLVRIPLKER